MMDTAQIAEQSALLERLRAGDEAAWRGFLNEIKPRVQSVIFRYCRDWQEAEAMTWKAFEHAHRSLDHFRGEVPLPAWIIRIGRNLAFNHYAYHKRRHRDEHTHLDAEVSGALLAEVIPSHDPTPVDEVNLRELERAAMIALGKLGGRERRLLELRLAGKSYLEISAELEINLGTVKSAIARARERLSSFIQT